MTARTDDLEGKMDCNHPVNAIESATLALECPDCGARCSETQIGDDRLCYDQWCPLHVMAAMEAKMKTIDISEMHWLRWTVAGEDQGQMVERATAQLDEGETLERRYDRSDRSVTYWLDGERVRVIGDARG